MTIPGQSYSRIIFFDGTCNLCNGFIDFVVSRDKRQILKIASLQGETAASILSADIREGMSTVVFYDHGQIYYESVAVLRVMRLLGFPWSLFKIFQFVPTKWSNIIYRLVARKRYKWFGRRQTCRLPTPKEKEFFLP